MDTGMINQAVGAACVGERGVRTGFRSAPELDSELQVPPPVLGETGTDEEIVEPTAILRLDRREELTERRLERVGLEQRAALVGETGQLLEALLRGKLTGREAVSGEALNELPHRRDSQVEDLAQVRTVSEGRKRGS